MEDCHVDKQELLEQYYQAILDKDKFVEVKVIIETDTKQCIPSIQIRNAGIKDVTFMISSLEQIKQKLIKEFPLAGLLSTFGEIEIQDVLNEDLKKEEDE